MPHGFQREQTATRTLALVVVASLFCIAVLVAIYQDRNDNGGLITVGAALLGCRPPLDK